MHTILEVVVLTLLGFVGGFIGSQVGAGGIIMLPGLLWLGLSVPASIAAMSIAGLLTNGVAALEYSKSKHLKLHEALPYATVAALGSAIGAKLLFKIDVEILSTIFAVVIALLTAFLIFRRQPTTTTLRKTSKPIFVLGLLISFVIGLYGGLVAIAVTTLAILFFQAILRQNYLTAVANAVFIVTVLQVTQVFVLVTDTRINYVYALLLVPGSIFGAVLGSKTIARKGETYFKALLVLVAILVVIKLVTA